MATLLSDLCAETRQHVLGGQRVAMNKLAAAVSTVGQTTITFTYNLDTIKPGSIISIGLERMLVWATTDSSKTATVERGYDGTTATTHLIDTLVRVNATQHDDFACRRAINNELASLSSPANGLFRVRTVDLTYSAAAYGYDLTSSGTVIGKPLSVSLEWPETRGWTPLRNNDWSYNAAADTTDFASGHSITLKVEGSPGLKVRVAYRAPFVALTSLTDDVQTVAFLPATANDIPPLGAALQLAAARSMRRADITAQGSTRRAEEVTTQDTVLSMRDLRQRRDERIKEEAARLISDYPTVA